MGLYAKMAAIMGAIDKVDKDKEMQSGPRYKYVTDVQVYHTVRKLLIEHSIALFASMTDVEQTRIVTSVDDKGNERDKFHTRARFEFVLVDSESGEQMTCTWYGESQDVGDKGVNKCATAALKYWLLKTFIIPTGDDPDDTASGTVGRTVNAKTGEVTRSEAQPTTRAQRSTHNPPKPSVADELPPAAQEMGPWTHEPGRINKMVAWARETVWEGIELPHARNRVAKALDCTNFASIAAEYKGTPEQAMAAIQAYVPSDERAPAEQPQLVEAPVPADTPQKRRKAG